MGRQGFAAGRFNSSGGSVIENAKGECHTLIARAKWAARNVLSEPEDRTYRKASHEETPSFT